MADRERILKIRVLSIRLHMLLEPVSQILALAPYLLRRIIWNWRTVLQEIIKSTPLWDIM